jgi:hypothetical protein
MYDLRENNVLRQHQWDQIREEKGKVTRKRSPMRVDCFYMLTTWAADPEDEHRLMTRCLMALFRHPIIPEEVMVGAMQKPLFEVQARLAAHDRLTNPAEVWSSLDNEMRPSVSYIISLALDPWQEIDTPAVRTYSFNVGQAFDPSHEKTLEERGEGMALQYFGGSVHEKGNEKQALPGIQVAVKGTGFFTTTDSSGRFLLGGLPAGEYTLVAWPAKGKPIEKKVSLPAGEGDYDIWI